LILMEVEVRLLGRPGVAKLLLSLSGWRKTFSSCVGLLDFERL